jgi:hypothetical protein
MQLDIEIRGIDHMQKLAGTFRQPALRALNKVARSTETFANARVRDEYNISRGEVDKGLTFKPGSISHLTAVLRARGPRLGLFGFIHGSRRPRTLRKRAGVQVQVKRGQVRLLKGAFVATMPSGHTAIMVRSGRARLPIVERKTLSIAGMLGARKVSGSVKNFFKEKLPAVFQHELTYWLSQQ